MDIYKNIEKRLIELSDDKFKQFNSKLCPDTNMKLLGIKIPQLRKLAKNIIKENIDEEFLKNVEDKYFEEIILQGFVIAYSKKSIDEKFIYMKKFIPKMDSWEMTDTFVPTLKIKAQDLQKYWDFVIPYIKSKKEFEVRFAIISMLDYFIIEEYIDKVIDELDKIDYDGYYVKMAIAWTLAEIGIKYNDKFMNYMNSNKNHLDKFTYNKTLQKMIESYRVDKDQKEILKSMKIK